MDLSIETETVTGLEDRSWLGSAHGVESTQSCTLDAALFTPATHYPNGEIRSGIVLGLVTATGLYGPYGGRANEVQTVGLGAATAGSVTITFDGEVTGAIAFNATAAQVQTAMEGLSNINPGDVAVTGGPLPGGITLTFNGRYAGLDVPQVVVTPTGLTGGTVTVATATQGGSTVNDGREVARGHLFNTVRVSTATARIGAPILEHGRVRVANLPANHGLDAAARVDLPSIRYAD
jgi:hypothetical protein